MAEINTNETISEVTEVATEVTETPAAEVPTPDKKGKKKEKSAKKKNAKPNFFVRLAKRVAKFFREYNSERKKVVWKPAREVFKSLGVVVVTVAVFSLAIFVIDLAFGSFFDWIPDAITYFFG